MQNIPASFVNGIVKIEHNIRSKRLAKKSIINPWKSKHYERDAIWSVKNSATFTSPKLGIMKQFVKLLPKDGRCFMYLCDKFKYLSNANIRTAFLSGLR